jgi:RNA polymerase sigma-70 factor (ECF subfamily)
LSSARFDWQGVLASHQRWLRTVAHARLRDGEAVDEVMQEVALAAVRQSAPLTDPAKAAPWLYRLTIRQVLLLRRRLGRSRRLLDRYAERGGTLTTAGHGDPLEWLLADERRELVRRALQRMPAREREILMLKYAEDWSYHQIASHLGASHSAIEARLHRARRRLRTALVTMNLVETTP